MHRAGVPICIAILLAVGVSGCAGPGSSNEPLLLHEGETARYWYDVELPKPVWVNVNLTRDAMHVVLERELLNWDRSLPPGGTIATITLDPATGQLRDASGDMGPIRPPGASAYAPRAFRYINSGFDPAAWEVAPYGFGWVAHSNPGNDWSGLWGGVEVDVVWQGDQWEVTLRSACPWSCWPNQEPPTFYATAQGLRGQLLPEAASWTMDGRRSLNMTRDTWEGHGNLRPVTIGHAVAPEPQVQGEDCGLPCEPADWSRDLGFQQAWQALQDSTEFKQWKGPDDVHVLRARFGTDFLSAEADGQMLLLEPVVDWFFWLWKAGEPEVQKFHLASTHSSLSSQSPIVLVQNDASGYPIHGLSVMRPWSTPGPGLEAAVMAALAANPGKTLDDIQHLTIRNTIGSMLIEPDWAHLVDVVWNLENRQSQGRTTVNLATGEVLWMIPAG